MIAMGRYDNSLSLARSLSLDVRCVGSIRNGRLRRVRLSLLLVIWAI